MTVNAIDNVYINARFLTQPLTGMQRYAYSLVMRMPQACLLSPDDPRPAYEDVPSAQLRVQHSRLKSHLWEQIVLPQAIEKNAILWSPTGIGPLVCSRHVLTIPDMGYVDVPECYSSTYRLLYSALYPIVARKARKIICISHHARERVLATMRVPEEKVVVIYPAADARFCPQAPEHVQATLAKHQIPDRYILALGAVSPRKNFRRLLEAWKRISGDYDGVEMVVVGQKNLVFSSGDELGPLPPHTRHLTDVDDTLLIQLYAGALAFAYPSLYEGFGLPVLEAMGIGTPVLTANTTSLPEVTGDAALLVDPLSIDEIAAGLRRLLEDADLRAELAWKGKQQALQFSWDDAARQTWKVLCET